MNTKEIVKIPEGTKSVIVAELYVDESDTQRDYFGASVKKTVYLGFSTSTRNNEKELQKFAKLLPETEMYKDAKAQKSSLYYQPSYFIGSNTISGWKVSKLVVDLSHEYNLNKLRVAASNGLLLANNTEK